MNTRPMRALGAGLGLALSATLLVGCGDDEPTGEPTKSASSETTDEASEEPTEATEEPSEEPTEATSAAAPEGSAELTEAGTELAIGDTAVVAGENAGKDFVMKVTVTKIDQAKPGDLDDMKSSSFDPAKYQGAYIRFDATVVSGDASGGNPGSDIKGMVDDEPATNLIKFSSFEPCENETFETGAVGEKVSSCEIVVAPKGQQVNRAAYVASLSEEPIVWK